jgi:hypothetical protein
MNRRPHCLHPNCAGLGVVCTAGWALLGAWVAVEVEACTGEAEAVQHAAVAAAVEVCTDEAEADFVAAEACRCGQGPDDSGLAAQ